jgi:hypothetical protein
MPKESSGTSAGYLFAQKNGLSQQYEVDAYSGPSDSFRNGMQKWVDEVIAKEKSQQATNAPSSNQATT